MSWGRELWDRHEAVAEENSKAAAHLGSTYARFLKEKGEVEREYAKGLRRLVTRFEPGKCKEEETTETTSFRQILREIGYQAGQHELLADNLIKTLCADLQKKSKDLGKAVKDNCKAARKCKEVVDLEQQEAEKAKQKYHKSFSDWQEAIQNYERADADGTLSRNEILKMKILTDMKSRTHGDCKNKYQSQLSKTNSVVREHNTRVMPSLLDQLQAGARERLSLLCKGLTSYVRAEQEMFVILGKCQKEIIRAVEKIDWVRDESMVVDRLKTGEVPPPDVQFQDMSATKVDRERKSSSLSRRISRVNFNYKKEKQSLFQERRKLTKKVDALKIEIGKGTKEMRALQLMIQTYTNTPQFGDAAKFQPELNTVAARVQKQEAELSALQRNLDLVESKMSLNCGGSLLGARSVESLTLRGSLGEGDSQGSDEGSPGEGQWSGSSSEEGREVVLGDNDWGEDFQDDDEDNEEVELRTEGVSMMGTMDGRLSALYSYSGEEEGTLALEPGQQFRVVGEEQEGWVKVQRISIGATTPGSSGELIAEEEEEGYIPIAFTEPV